jgi:hypothetical protein
MDSKVARLLSKVCAFCEEGHAIMDCLFVHVHIETSRVALKYPNFKKDVNPNVHVKVFNYIVKVKAETSEKYIINAFNYALKRYNIILVL